MTTVATVATPALNKPEGTKGFMNIIPLVDTVRTIEVVTVRCIGQSGSDKGSKPFNFTKMYRVIGIVRDVSGEVISMEIVEMDEVGVHSFEPDVAEEVSADRA